MSEMCMELYVGQRIMITVHSFGTICFIGEIPNSKGIWLGVDWDDATRGRHDGCFLGKSYFKTHHPSSGSFIRPNKVKTGLTYSQALQERYCHTVKELQELSKCGLQLPPSLKATILDSCGDFDTDPNKELQLLLTNRREKRMISGVDPLIPLLPTGLTIELLDVDDSLLHTDLCQVKQVILQGVPISSCSMEEAEYYRNILTSTKEVDLSSTLISDWSTVAKILHSVPNANLLRVNSNRLRLPLKENTIEKNNNNNSFDQRKYYLISSSEYSFLETKLSQIKEFIAVRVNYEWQEFWQILPFFKHACRLIIALNGFTHMTGFSALEWSNLHTLDIAGSCFDSSTISEEIIQMLSKLPCLENLYMSNCKLHDFSLPMKINDGNNEWVTDVPSNIFPCLKCISLCNNNIQRWSTIYHLNRLPTLEELTFLENPVLELSSLLPDTLRLWIIASIRRLKILNHLSIDFSERKLAEMEYLQAHSNICADLTENELTAACPRWNELVSIYEVPDRKADMACKVALKETLITVYISCPQIEPTNIIEKKILSKMSVQHLKSLVRRLFKLNITESIRITYSHDTSSKVEFELNAVTREVGFYNVSNGDHLYVYLL